MKAVVPLIVGALIGLLGPAQARTLDDDPLVRRARVLRASQLASFARKAGDPPGFQVELGQALARELGVTLRLDWIITQYQMRSAGCDFLLDVIADREAQGETRLRISKPYYRTGVALAVPPSSALTSFSGLNGSTKVGVQVGSVAAMIIGQRRVPISTFGFETDSLDAVSNRRDRCRRGHADRGELFQPDASGQGAPHPGSRRERGRSQLERRRRHGPPG